MLCVILVFIASLNAGSTFLIHELVQHRRLQTSNGRTEITPMYQGYGTHYSYIYVGTPPQRQSVIVDTGSHYTAFPCVGCKHCGKHIDQYWDIRNSSTSVIPQCQSQPCTISQRYSEGSSWKAIKVLDKLWVGGLNVNSVRDASEYAIDFQFGCQTSETGLFRTQLADGIMGMGMSEDTIPYQLFKQGVTKSKVFALCFRMGGGIMTLGGIEERMHITPGILYAKLNRISGWYTLNLIDVILIHRETQSRKSLGPHKAIYDSGKGTIVDSGTTDTYLPRHVARRFVSIFKEFTGITFSQAKMILSQSQLDLMPDVAFVFDGSDDIPFEVIMSWRNYVDSLGGGKYAFRIYLTEGSGAVLGANFMSGYNVIFDSDGRRVGFAKSECKYEAHSIPQIVVPTSGATELVNASSQFQSNLKCQSTISPIGPCTARCTDATSSSYSAVGTQNIAETCNKSSSSLAPKTCHKSCNYLTTARGDAKCPGKSWSGCSKSCSQSRNFPSFEGGDCAYTKQSRTCYIGSCSRSNGDFLIFLDLRLYLMQRDEWNFVHSEEFFCAFSSVLNVRESSIALLNHSSSGLAAVDLHFEIRLRAKDFEEPIAFRIFAQSIPEMIWESSFRSDLIAALEVCSTSSDSVDYSRYGYLLPKDVEIQNAVALPFGGQSDPADSPFGADTLFGSLGSPVRNLVLLLLFVIAAAVSCCFCLQSQTRHRREYTLFDTKKIGSHLKGQRRELQ